MKDCISCKNYGGAIVGTAGCRFNNYIQHQCKKGKYNRYIENPDKRIVEMKRNYIRRIRNNKEK